MTPNYLLDTEFLQKMDTYPQREIYAKIIALNLEEYPIEDITGSVTQGNINVDGKSAVRRTCSVTLTTKELNIHDYYWGLNTKFKLEIGMRNFVDKKYDDIIWFPQGMFLISSFSTTQNLNSYQISIQGKDKMCLLNGELGGTITSLTHNFSQLDNEQDDGSIVEEDVLIKDIIIEAVHAFAKEPYHNIIVNDLDEIGLSLMEYRGKTPIYLYWNEALDEYYCEVNGDKKVYYKNAETALKDLDDSIFTPRLQIDAFDSASFGQKIKTEANGTEEYYIAKIEAGETIGYQITPLVYAGELIASIGNNITTAVLDKIVQMLGDFEYFYNVEGQFVFQRKRAYINTTWNPIKKDGEGEIYIDNAYNDSPAMYSFENDYLISSFQNKPSFQNLKNDYTIWGSKGKSSDKSKTFHMRYAIDIKPTYYKTYTGEEYTSDKYDWRELIYQMALDNLRHQHDDDFLMRIAQNNLQYYPKGYTGYEQYYTDMLGFWRLLYNPEYISENGEIPFGLKQTSAARYHWGENNYTFFWYKKCSNEAFNPSLWYYITDLSGNYIRKQKLDKANYDAHPDWYYVVKTNKDPGSASYAEKIEYEKNSTYSSSISYYALVTSETCDFDNNGWAKNILENPENLVFWFDFLDGRGELASYSVQAIGIRPKVENNSNIRAIYFRETPNIILIGNQDENEFSQAKLKMPGYSIIQIPEYVSNLFVLSAKSKSAKDIIDSWLYQHSYCAESATITTLPIYYLQPNTRIFIHDDNSGIEGEYIVEKISMQLNHNGTMSITATKAVDRII